MFEPEVLTSPPVACTFPAIVRTAYTSVFNQVLRLNKISGVSAEIISADVVAVKGHLA
jgi:hypothetical protein